MNRILIIVGVLCAGLGLALWVTAPGERRTAPEGAVSVGEAPASAVLSPGEGRGHADRGEDGDGQASQASQANSVGVVETSNASSAETSTDLINPLRDDLPRHERCHYQTACGAMPALITQLRSSDHIAELPLPAFALRGHAEVLIRSTLGGLDQGVRVSADWSIAKDGSIHLRTSDAVVIARLHAGRWVLDPQSASPVLLEVARLVTALQDACATPRILHHSSVVRVFDQDWTVTGLTPTAVLCESSDRLDPDGPRDALIFALADNGAIARLERFQSDPSTVNEPGFMVRRVRLDGFTDPLPEPGSP